MALFKRRKRLQGEMVESEEAPTLDIPVVPFVEDVLPVELESSATDEESSTPADLSTQKMPSDLSGVSFICEEGSAFEGPQLTANIQNSTPHIDVTQESSDDEDDMPEDDTLEPVAAQPEDETKDDDVEPAPPAVDTEALNQSIKSLEAQVKDRDARLQTLRDDIAHMSGQLDDAHRIMSQTRHDLSISSMSAETQGKELREALKKVAALTAKTKEQASEAQLKTSDINALRGQLASADEQLLQMKTLRVALGQSESAKTTLTEQLKTVKVKIAAYEAKIETKIKAYQDKIQQQDALIAELKTEIASNKVLMSETARSVTQIRTSTSNTEKDYVRVKKQVAEHLSTIAKTNAELEKSRQINTVLKQRLAKTISEYQPAAIEVPDINEQLERDVTVLKAQNLELKKRLKQSLSRTAPSAPAPAAQELDTLREENNALQIQLDQVKSPMNAEDLIRLQQIITDQKQQLTETREQLNTQQSEAAARDKRYDEVAKALEQSQALLSEQTKIEADNVTSMAIEDEDDIKLSADDDVFEATETDGLTTESIEDMILDFKLGNRQKIG